MKKLSLKQQFVRFLMTHGALRKFYDNYRSSDTVGQPLHSFPKQWIAWAFAWRDTREGYVYWYRLYNLWDLYLKEPESVKTITLCGVKWLVENEVTVNGNKYFTTHEAMLHLNETRRRLPTKDDFDKLCKLPNCWDTIKNGRWFAENEKDLKDPEKSLFLPAAGFRDVDASLNSVGSQGRYWSSTIRSAYACNLYFLSDNVYQTYNYIRRLGFSVRCILNE